MVIEYLCINILELLKVQDLYKTIQVLQSEPFEVVKWPLKWGILWPRIDAYMYIHMYIVYIQYHIYVYIYCMDKHSVYTVSMEKYRYIKLVTMVYKSSTK